MDVTRKDAEQVKVLIKILDKLRFDVSGVECLRLADALVWIAQLDQRIVSYLDSKEALAAKEKLRNEMVAQAKKDEVPCDISPSLAS